MSYSIRPFSDGDAAAWDLFCDNSLQATFLHTRKFLSYHGTRFEDQSLIIEEDGKCLGLLPAARHPSDRTTVVSHPGSTYGGIVHQGALRGERMLMALRAIIQYYRDAGYSNFSYKAVPTFYHSVPAQDDLYAFHRLNVSRSRCDISSTIELTSRLPISSRRHRSLKKAISNNLTLSAELCHLPALWAVLADNLARKHGTKPVHTLAEIEWLIDRFPDNIRICCALADNQVVAGVVLFISKTTWHAQYIASSEQGYELNSLDLIFSHCIELAQSSGKRYFDFGISTESNGNILNEGLFCFKSEFGAGSTVHEFFNINLREAHHGIE